MILGSRAELAGRVKLQISGGERGTIDYPWQDNMILDQGFVRLITTPNMVMTCFGVGGSSQEVSPTDTGLIAPIARVTNSTTTGNLVHSWVAEGGYGKSTRFMSFARGVAAGNISELSTGWADNNTSAAARALVRDTGGNPTTITVLADEVLTVTWEWRRWWAVSEPHLIEFDVDGDVKSTTVSYKPESGLSKDSNGIGSGGIVGANSSLISSSGGVFIGEFKRGFSESQGNPQVSSVSTSGDEGGGSSSSGGGVVPTDSAYATFTPPIAKTNEFVLEIRHRITLTRRAP